MCLCFCSPNFPTHFLVNWTHPSTKTRALSPFTGSHTRFVLGPRAVVMPPQPTACTTPMLSDPRSRVPHMSMGANHLCRHGPWCHYLNAFLTLPYKPPTPSWKQRDCGGYDMATGAAEGLLWGVYEGCISGCDMGIERRPYHRNCKCALHKSKGNTGSRAPAKGSQSLSYRIRRSWSEGSLVLAASRGCSPSSSPVVAMEVGRTQLGLYNEDGEEEEGVVSCKVWTFFIFHLWIFFPE